MALVARHISNNCPKICIKFIAALQSSKLPPSFKVEKLQENAQKTEIRLRSWRRD